MTHQDLRGSPAAFTHLRNSFRNRRVTSHLKNGTMKPITEKYPYL